MLRQGGLFQQDAAALLMGTDADQVVFLCDKALHFDLFTPLLLGGDTGSDVIGNLTM